MTTEYNGHFLFKKIITISITLGWPFYSEVDRYYTILLKPFLHCMRKMRLCRYAFLVKKQYETFSSSIDMDVFFSPRFNSISIYLIFLFLIICKTGDISLKTFIVFCSCEIYTKWGLDFHHKSKIFFLSIYSKFYPIVYKFVMKKLSQLSCNNRDLKIFSPVIFA